MRQATWQYRMLEMVPGLLIWTTFTAAIVLSFTHPLWVIYFIIAYDLLWFLRVMHFIVFIIFSFRTYRATVKQDWLTQVKSLPNWERIYHIIYLPTYGESLEVLETTFDGLLRSHYPADKLIVVLGGEERAGHDFEPKAEELKKKYAHRFHHLLVTVHPDGLEGEIKGKGANAHWMGEKSRVMIDELGLFYDDLIVSYFDCDTAVHPEYFAYLAYKYLTHPTPTRVSYQPLVNYNNNIWDAPAVTRVTAFGTVFWLMMELMRPERLFTFSSHSMSFRALVDVGYWQKDVVSDDSRIFLQGFFRYDGNYAVEPMYVPVSMDTCMDQSYWKSLRNLYKQQRRWAWGVEHFPYMMTEFWKNRKISFIKKFKYGWNQVEGMYSWATAPILMFVLGRLPLYVAGRGLDSASVIVQNAPYVLEQLMTVSMIGMIFSAALSMLILPAKPAKYPRSKYLIMLLQWLLMPITFILFGSIPAIESQTRLMLGSKFHLGFWVTPKARK